MVQALLVAGLMSAVGPTAAPPKAAPADPAAVLRDAKADLGKVDPAAPLTDVLRALARRHDLTFIVDNTAFKDPVAVAAAKPAGPAPRPAGQTVGDFLDTYLNALGAPEGVTYVVRPDYVEITSRPKRLAEKVARVFPVAGLVTKDAKPTTAADAAAKVARALEQNVILPGGDLRQTPLTDVLRDLAKAHDLTILIDNLAFENPGTVADAKAALPPAANLAKLTLGRFLDVYLGALPVGGEDPAARVTYIARPDHIEITSVAKARAEEKKDATADGAVKLVKLLNNEPVGLGDQLDLQTAPFVDVLRELARRYDITFVIDGKAFENPAVLSDAKANLSAARLEGMPLGTFLQVYLRALPVPEHPTYLVRSWGIEITSRQKALEEAGLTEAQESAGETAAEQAAVRARARLPLVSVVADDRPLAEVLKELARAYSLNLVIDRPVRNRVGDAAVTARLLNVPADTALELLAEQAELSVVRKGNTFRITGGGAQ